MLWNERLRFEGPENDALHACSELGRLGSAAHDFLDPHEQQRLAADEAVRWRHMSRLAGEFKDMMGGKLGNKWQRHFEKWLYSRRAGCPTCPAGCFPIGPNSETDPELQRKLQATGASAKEAAFLAKMLGKASHKAAAAVSRAAPGLLYWYKVQIMTLSCLLFWHRSISIDAAHVQARATYRSRKS